MGNLPYPLVVGVDAGGTNTRAWIALADGMVMGRGEAGPGNCSTLGIDGSARAIQAAVAAARAAASPECPDTRYTALFAGVAGAGAVEDQQELAGALARHLQIESPRCRVDHDMRVALAGALPNEPGMVVIAGTGSVCFGRDEGGRAYRAGGWGPVLDDGGSGTWLGVQALREVVRVGDGRAAESALADTVRAKLGSRAPREALRWAREIMQNRERIAALAPLVLEAAEAGDASALSVIDRGIREIVAMVEAVVSRMQGGADACRRLAACGGLLASQAIYRRRLEAELLQRVPGLVVVDPELPPCGGAVLLAIEAAGGRVNADVISRLKATAGSAAS